ncbi:hypothetical protein [Paenibacillus sp. GXUN7292]|uniref:hypothetical protein n=1 Tax=Paenibacillus sp. GXUN7292 TaxID=3422499 RepID=UPI003D7C8773
MGQAIKDSIFKLEGYIGNIGLKVETLQDVQALLYRLRTDMDDAVHKGCERHYFSEYHRSVRVLSELMNHLVDELASNYKQAHELHSSMHEKFVRGGAVS